MHLLNTIDICCVLSSEQLCCSNQSELLKQGNILGPVFAEITS